jgi:hypothetical protein
MLICTSSSAACDMFFSMGTALNHAKLQAASACAEVADVLQFAFILYCKVSQALLFKFAAGSLLYQNFNAAPTWGAIGMCSLERRGI